MKENLDRIKALLLLLTVACLAAAGGFYAGRSKTDTEILKRQQQLYALNRSSVENLSIGDSTVYVIGHRSPDSDTVCSAIAYARLLNLLGIPAEARITESMNKETEFILKEAGVEPPTILDDASGENIFLVDHSEYAQAVEGLSDAHIVGIIDHHGVGTVTTGHQLLYDARPIGSTATIIWLAYQNYGFEIDPVTAYLMLGAVLSDTDGLTGSTTTGADRQAVISLAGLSGVEDVAGLYKQIHTEKLSYEGMTNEEIFFSDYKEYEASGMYFGIGLINAIDEEAASELAERMKEIGPEAFGKRDVDLMYASVGIRENGEKIDYIIPCSQMSDLVFRDAFPNYDEYDGTSYIFRSGLGRKTKFVPALTDYLGMHPHE